MVLKRITTSIKMVESILREVDEVDQRGYYSHPNCPCSVLVESGRLFQVLGEEARISISQDEILV